jgi:hypothetical protein
MVSLSHVYLLIFGMCSPPPKVSSNVPRNTDAILTVVIADGSTNHRCAVFTSNMALDPRQYKQRKRQMEAEAELGTLLSKYGISRDRIFFVTNNVLEGVNVVDFVNESPALVKAYFERFPLEAPHLATSVVYSDGGNAFKSVDFKSFGFAAHRVYPACVHQFLSPNDNNLHGAAKVKWRLQKLGQQMESAEETHLLMHLIDIDQNEHSRFYFDRNRLLGPETDRSAQALELVGGSQSNVRKREIYHNQCYRKFLRLKKEADDDNSTDPKQLIDEQFDDLSDDSAS